jgi:hypothetical protein
MIRLVLWLLLSLIITGCMTTTQFKDIPSGKDAAGNPRVIRTYAREGIRFGFGTDYVIPVQQRCTIDGDGAVSVCDILDANIVGSETFFENLTTGAALGAFFPLIRPGNSGSSSSSSSNASAEAENSTKVNVDVKKFQRQSHRPHGDRD